MKLHFKISPSPKAIITAVIVMAAVKLVAAYQAGRRAKR